MKATNTEHTVINGNQSKCRMTQFNLGGALTKSGEQGGKTHLYPPENFCLTNRESDVKDYCF